MHGAEITFLSTNVDIATLVKGLHQRALNVKNVDIADSNLDVGIGVGVVSELTSADRQTAGRPKNCMVVVREV